MLSRWLSGPTTLLVTHGLWAFWGTACRDFRLLEGEGLDVLGFPQGQCRCPWEEASHLLISTLVGYQRQLLEQGPGAAPKGQWVEDDPVTRVFPVLSLSAVTS